MLHPKGGNAPELTEEIQGSTEILFLLPSVPASASHEEGVSQGLATCATGTASAILRQGGSFVHQRIAAGESRDLASTP